MTTKLIARVMSLALLLPSASSCLRERSFHSHGHGLTRRSLTPRAELSAHEQLIISSFDSQQIDWNSYYYTHGNHIAGKNQSQAQWTADRWAEAGFSSRVDSYNVYLNYPVSRSLVLTWPNGTTYTPTLEEAVLEEDETSSYPNRIPTFHGFSANGNVSAEYVYVGKKRCLFEIGSATNMTSLHQEEASRSTLLAYHLASDELLPLEPLNYANEMTKYYQALQYTIGTSTRPDFDASSLEAAISTFRIQAQEAADLARTDDHEVLSVVNRKYRDFQRDFTSQGGLPDREFFQHLIFAPGLDTGYAPVTFPGIVEAIDREKWEQAEEYLEKTVRAIKVAGSVLKT